MDNNSRMGPRNIKILFITLEFSKEICGGIGRVVNCLADSLAPKIDLDVLLIRNFRIIRYTRLYQMRNQRWNPKIYGHFQSGLLIDLIHKENYDIVHIFHTSIICFEAIKTIKKFFPRLKIIYSCHSITRYEFNIRSNQPALLDYENFIIHNADHIHLLNQSSLTHLIDSYPTLGGKINYSIIPNGISEDSINAIDARFSRQTLHLINRNDTINVLCLSRWSWGKGLEYLLDAIPLVTAHYKNIKFIIAGRRWISWEYKYWNYLWKISRKIAMLKGYVISMGWLNDRQRNTLFSRADIWIMPSQLEYFPYSILEPMMAKIPIIASRIDSVAEILRDKEECLFYEPQNPAQLANHILTLINNPALRDRLANNAYRKVKECYRWDRISDMYLNMYYSMSQPR